MKAPSAGSSREEEYPQATHKISDNQAGIGYTVADLIKETTESETRVTVLGHVQRGGTPNSRDRLFASVFGVAAVDLIADEKYNQLVVWADRKCIHIPLESAISKSHNVDPKGTLVATARGLGIYVGNHAPS